MVRVIHTREEHEAALQRLQQLMQGDPPLGTEAGDELKLLALVIEDYESRVYPNDSDDDLDPVEALLFVMDQKGLRPIDLVPYIGSRGRVSEVLSRKRQLTLPMIRRLSAGLGIPAEWLIQEPQPATPASDEVATP